MVPVPAGGGVRLVCLECLRSAFAVDASGRRGVTRGVQVKSFGVSDLILWLEKAEYDAGPGGLDASSVPGFDAVLDVCGRAGVPYTSEGVRTLVRKLAAKTCEPVAKIMGQNPATFAAAVRRERIRGDAVPASAV